MEAYKIKPEFVISDEETLQSHYSELSPLAAKKCLSALDKHARDFIARSPFLCLGTQNTDGKADVSPRGDPVGFVTGDDENGKGQSVGHERSGVGLLGRKSSGATI